MSNESTGSALGGLTLYPTGLSRTELDLKGGKGFWDDANRIIEQSILGGQVDTIMAGKAAPRVWAFVAESGQSAVAVAAALSCAAALAERGQTVILLDGDDHHPDLTRWAGRFELEGWIDLIRYGASLTTCSIPMELKGRKSDLIGVGSFCPTQVSEQEIDELLGRLRRRADDILMIVPAGEHGQPWAERAQIRLLGWDQRSRSAKAAQELVDWLDDRGIKLTGLVGFGHETDEAVAARLRPATADPGESPSGPAVPAGGIATGPVLAAGDDDRTWEQQTDKTVAAVNDLATAAEAGTDEPGRSEPTERTASGAATAEDDFWTASTAGSRAPSRFWWLAALLGICILAGGIYYVENLNGTPAPPRSELMPANRVAALETPAAIPGGAEATNAAADTGTDAAGATAVAGPASGDGAPVVTTGSGDATAEPPPPAADGSVGDTGDEAAAERPYGVPAGLDGWTLHVYSFPRSDLAEAEVVKLERRGYRCAIRAVDVPDKGRWYRVYVGSFATREAALAARPELLRRLGADWAMPNQI